MIGDYSLTLTETTIPANTITIVPTIPTVSTIIGDITYYDFSGNMAKTNQICSPPTQIMGNWRGTFVDPKFALNAAIKDALKSGLGREEIDKMIDEAVCEEVVDS